MYPDIPRPYSRLGLCVRVGDVEQWCSARSAGPETVVTHDGRCLLVHLDYVEPPNLSRRVGDDCER